MTTDTNDIDISEAVSLLNSDPDSLSWTQRCELARRSAETLVGDNVGSAGVRLARVLARDPKWEVRAEVAELLVFLPDDDFRELAPLLASDSNHFVSQAAIRALDRRRTSARKANRTRRAAGEIARELQAIEVKHGVMAAKRAMRLCERHSELLVGSMVHDLRSLVTVILTDVLTVVEEYGKRRRAGTRLRGSLHLADQTLNDMRTYTQSLTPERHRERLVEVVTEAVEMAQSNVRKRRYNPDVVATTVTVSESIGVEIARHLVLMALSNVLTNAFEAFAVDDGTLRPGTIDVTARVDGDYVEIVVRDDGKGIPEEEISDPTFFLPGRRNKTKRHSTGYGLPIAVRNLAAHGGTLNVDSRRHAGTTVTITLAITSANTESNYETASIGG